MATACKDVDEFSIDEMPNCDHYLRRCCFVSPCCNKYYICRLCHDKQENHDLNRKRVEEIICLQCKRQQKISERCCQCHIKFGQYSCLVCRMFDDRDKKQFHCDFCKICRVGGKDNFFHCTRCDICLAISIKDSHKCIEKSSQSDCPVCLEDMHTSTQSLHVPSCGHMIHQKCYFGMREKGMITCPVCCTSYDDVTSIWKKLDEIVDETPLDEKYQDLKIKILCRDCHKESEAKFHVIGIKCGECGSYNTCQN